MRGFDDEGVVLKKKTFNTIGEYFNWIYSNMAMAHVALKNGHEKYETIDFMIRAKLYKGLNTGTNHIASIYDDEKYKLSNVKCAYCGETNSLTIDHLISRSKGGVDSGENLVYACSHCNSSKYNRDLLEWCMDKGAFPPILILRRYLKLAYLHFEENRYFELPFEQWEKCCNIFRLDLLPYEFPAPEFLKL